LQSNAIDGNRHQCPARGAILSSRSLTAEISPPILYEQGLVPALRWLAGWIGDKHDLSVELSSETVPARLPEDMIVLVFESVREILFNVVKHAAVDRAHVDVRCIDGRLRIKVMDRGAGFKPDSTHAPAASGGGFGLFSIRERLGLLGGELEIDSSPGRGTQVTLSAPAALEAPSPASGIDRRIRVLLVDDHPVMRDGLTRLFEPEPDIEVVGEASDGRLAIELAAKLIPDVVLMDVNMSGMGGVEANHLIRERLPQVRVVGLLMLNDLEVVRAMLAAGASAHLSKSGPSEEIVQAVRTCMQQPPHPGRPDKILPTRKREKSIR
jgi:CheY-like chemotaxis protein/anti-sigma regulatory factor (Ser/Thr protein kinase)